MPPSKLRVISFALFLLTIRQERLKFMVGRKSITAINDGSIIIEYSRFPNRVAFWGMKDHSQKIKSVVSIEVFLFLLTLNSS
jgi:hypothetical protein